MREEAAGGPRKEGVVIKSKEGLVRCYQGTGASTDTWAERRGKQAYPRRANSLGGVLPSWLVDSINHLGSPWIWSACVCL